MKYLGQYSSLKQKETVIRTDEGDFPIWAKDAEKYFPSLEVGEEIAESELLITLAVRREIKKKAIRKISIGDITKKTLIMKLSREKLYGRTAEREWIEELVEKLARAGYIDDDGFAKRYLEKCIAKLWGEMKIRGAMHDKGFDRETVDKALFEASVDFVALAKEYIEKNLSGETREVIWRKLSSRGFSSEVIAQAIEKND